MVRTVSTITAAAVLFAFSNLFAQESAPTLPSPAAVSAPEPTPAPVIEGEKKGEKHEMKEEGDGKGKGKGKGKGRGKGHGKKRGLERADEAAGDHGKQGRDNARSRGKHGKN